MRRVMFILTGSLILILSGCSNYEIPAPPCPEGTAGVSFAGDIQPIFDNKCVTCHSGSQSPDLSKGWAYDELIDGGYVDTESPCESVIYQVFSGTHDGRADTTDINAILGWIWEGAQDN